MKIVCISASNIVHSRNESTSLKISKIIGDIVKSQYSVNDFSIIDLREYTLNPCIGCGVCLSYKDQCINDSGYNKLSDLINSSDILFIVSPHYAPIPAKLVMLLEKLEQNTFIKRFNDETYRSPLWNKPVGIIGHGGGTKEIAPWYKGVIIESIANALSYPIEMKLCDYNDEYRNGIILSVDKVSTKKDAVFPIQEYDWDSIEKELTSYIGNVIIKEIKLTTAST